MCSALLKCHFDSPPLDEAAYYLYGRLALICAEICLWLQLPVRVTSEHPPDRQHRQANSVPYTCVACYLNNSLSAVVPLHLHTEPLGLGIFQHLVQFGQLLTFHSRAT